MKLEISLGNSECKLYNLSSSKVIKELTNLLTYEVPGAFFRNIPNYLKYKKLFNKEYDYYLFPTGLLFLVEEYLRNNNISFFITDNRNIPKTNRVFYFEDKSIPPLRDYQTKIIESCLESKRGVIESATGTGKTRTILELVKKLSLNTLIVVPSTSILYQAYDLFLKAFGKRLVGIIGDSKNQLDKDITIATYQSLEKLKESFWNKIDVLIIDEFHHSAADTFQRLNKKQFQKIYYRFGFTGTNFRNDGTDLALQGILSNVIFEYNAVSAINDGYLCPPIFYFYDTFHTDNLSLPPSQRKESDWQKEYREKIVENDAYHKQVSDIANQILSKGTPTIIFVQAIEHGEKLVPLIPNSVFLNGNNDSKLNKQVIQDFNAGKINCIIGTSIIGEGVDTVRAQCGIMAGGGKARSDIIQKIGRLLRPHPDKKFALVVDFVHHNTNFLSKHSKDREKVYKSYGTSVVHSSSEGKTKAS